MSDHMDFDEVASNVAFQTLTEEKITNGDQLATVLHWAFNAYVAGKVAAVAAGDHTDTDYVVVLRGDVEQVLSSLQLIAETMVEESPELQGRDVADALDIWGGDDLLDCIARLRNGIGGNHRGDGVAEDRGVTKTAGPRPQLLRPEEAAQATGLSRARIYELIASGEIPSIKIGKSRRIAVTDLETWIASMPRTKPKRAAKRHPASATLDRET